MENNEIRFLQGVQEFEIAHPERRLDLRILAGLKIIATNKVSQVDLDAVLEQETEPIIEEILQALDPKKYVKVLGLGEVKIWSLYWDIKQDPETTKIRFIPFLEALEKVL